MITGEIRILEVSDDRLRARADGSAMFGQRNIIQKRLVFLPDEYIYIYIYIYMRWVQVTPDVTLSNVTPPKLIL